MALFLADGCSCISAQHTAFCEELHNSTYAQSDNQSRKVRQRIVCVCDFMRNKSTMSRFSVSLLLSRKPVEII